MKAFLPFLLFPLLLIYSAGVSAQQIKPEKGYSQNIGVVVQMLEDLKRRGTPPPGGHGEILPALHF